VESKTLIDIQHPNLDEQTIRYLTRSASRPEGMSPEECRATAPQGRKASKR
jgi:hypothetical protein